MWRDRDFLRLWSGQTASQFGAQAVQLTLPLVAVVTLGASSTELGALRAIQQVPVLLFALFVGVWVDRWRVRNVLVLSDLGRAVALAAIPLFFLLHALDLTKLFVIGFLVGVFTMCFNVAYQACLPRLVRRDQLAQGNSLLEGSSSAAQIAGPSLGGAITTLLSAPIAVAASTFFFLVSVLSIWRVREAKPPPREATAASGMFRQIREGFGLIAARPSLRAIVLSSAAFQFSYAGLMTIYLVFLPRTLGLSAAEIGIVLAALGPGALLGSVLAMKLPGRLGYGLVLVSAATIADLAMIFVPALHGSGALTVTLLVVLNFLFGAFAQTVDITVTTVRLAVTPVQLQGRIAATVNFVGLGLTPVGSVLGGVLGVAIGVRAGLLLTAALLLLSPVCMLLSPLARMGRALPAADYSPPAAR